MKFGQKIKKLRTDAGLTQKDLANKLNVSFQTISKWESGLNEPDIANIKELCKVFDCSFEYLLNDDLDEKEEKKTIKKVEETKEEPEIEEKKEEEIPQETSPSVTEKVKKKVATCSDCQKDLFPEDSINVATIEDENGDYKVIRLCDECALRRGIISHITPKKPKVEEKKEETPIPVISANADKPKVTICSKCGKQLHVGDSINVVTIIDEYSQKKVIRVCDKCKAKYIEKEKNNQVSKVQKAKPVLTKEQAAEKRVLGWAIFGGIVGLGATLIACICNYQTVGIWWTIFAPIIIGYIVLADIYCIFSATWISELFLDVASWSIKMPGLIFTFNLDGILWLIGMKILFAIIGFLIGVGAFLLALALSSFMSIFCFPFMLASNN